MKARPRVCWARLGYRVIATDYAPPPPMSFYKLYYLLFHYGFEIEK